MAQKDNWFKAVRFFCGESSGVKFIKPESLMIPVNGLLMNVGNKLCQLAENSCFIFIVSPCKFLNRVKITEYNFHKIQNYIFMGFTNVVSRSRVKIDRLD